jgi:hypothetical protein
MRKIEFAIIALTVMVLLAACDPAPSNPSTALIADVPEYTAEQQKRAAEEMETHCDLLPMVCDTFMPDYKVMRDQARAAKKVLDI